MTDPGGSDESSVTGPHLVREVHPDLAQAAGTLWLAVNRAGGAVGFTPDAAEEDLRGAGWTEVGRWPGAVRVGPGDDRDEICFQLRL